MGLLLLFNGGFMLVAAGVSGIYHDGATLDIFLASMVTMFIGVLAMFATRGHKKEVKRKEGYLIVTFGWLVMSVSGMLPYLFSGAIPGVTNAFFETISGYTTTGASILNDIESLPEGILFWRSLTHWIGGMGIIVLAIAILPLLGIGGMQLFAAEAPGPSADKLHPRITDTAKRLWYIYVGYTAAETILLKLAGMSFFDAINHSLATLSTGGFSTKNASLAFWNDQPLIQYIVILFMFLAGMEVDFGGIGKEYAVDQALAAVSAFCDQSALVNFGGDLAVSRPRDGGGAWRTCVEKSLPGADSHSIDLHRGALATSGDARRFLMKEGKRYSHVLDPRSGWPVQGAPHSVTVAADTCTQAGMLATLGLLCGERCEMFLDEQEARYWVQLGTGLRDAAS